MIALTKENIVSEIQREVALAIPVFLALLAPGKGWRPLPDPTGTTETLDELTQALQEILRTPPEEAGTGHYRAFLQTSYDLLLQIAEKYERFSSPTPGGRTFADPAVDEAFQSMARSVNYCELIT